MITTIIVNIISVFFASLARKNNFKYSLEFAFIILAIFLAIRYDWGNDYPAYLKMYNSINSYDFDIFNFNNSNIYKDGELGWVFINKFFHPIGFFGMVIILTIIENFIIYRFIKKYVDPSWYWLSIFIYVFSSELMLTGCSMMRQFLAMCIYIVATDFIIRRKPIKFILLILLAASFHTSALILLPTYFVTYIRYELKPKDLLIIVPIFYVWLISGGYLLEDSVKGLILLDEFNKYDIYLSKQNNEMGLGVFFFSIMFFTCIYYMHQLKPNLRILCMLFLIGLLLIPLNSVAELIGRIMLYFSILSIIVYPLIFKNIKDKIFKYSIILAYIIFTLLGFFRFFYSDTWHDKFFEYQTIFSASHWM